MPDFDLECPLLVVTNDYPDEDGPAVITLARCEQSLYLKREDFAELDLVDGTGHRVHTGHVYGPEWRVECGNGHVLVVGVTDGEDPIPIDLDRISDALHRTVALHPHLPNPPASPNPVTVHIADGPPPVHPHFGAVQAAFEEGRAYERRHR